MEDVCRVHDFGFDGDENLAYIGVYDGHGGRDIVDFLETTLERNIAHELKHKGDDGDDLNNNNNLSIPQRLQAAFLLTDIQSRAKGILTSGATVASLVIQKRPSTNSSSASKRNGSNKRSKSSSSSNSTTGISIYSANCGDARSVLCKRDMTSESPSYSAIRLSHDHKADDPEEIARIEQAGGFVLRGRVLGILAVARSLGDHGMKDFVVSEPFVSATNVNVEDDEEAVFVICACDGLWDVMEDDEAVAIVLEYAGGEKEKRQAAQALADEALKRKSADNITVVVGWF